jgi:hypothetical protein
MSIEELTNGLHAIKPFIQRIADGTRLSFEEAWTVVMFYKQHKDTDAFVDYVENVPRSEFGKLLEDVKRLKTETASFLHIYNSAKDRFKSFDPKPIFNEHLQPSLSEYKAAQEKATAAWQDFKELHNKLDMPEHYYSKEELPKIWELHEQKKALHEECSKRTKELFDIYDKERRKTSPLSVFRLSALVMMVYDVDMLSKALIEDLEELKGKEGTL